MNHHVLKAIVFGAALSVAACGSNSTAPSSTTTTPTTTTTTAPTLPTATASGPVAECRLPSSGANVGIGLPRNALRLPASGDVRLVVLFVDFPDAPATRSVDSAYALISPTAEAYYRAVSYGKLNLIFQPSLVWRRMSKPSTEYGWASLTNALHRAYIQEAVDLAGSAVSYGSAAGIVVISNPDAGALFNGPAFSSSANSVISAGGRSFSNAITSGRDLISWGAYWANHELGHTLGLPDLYATGSSPTHRFVGVFSLMGLINGPAREYTAWERWVLGWVSDDQVFCAKTGTNVTTLSPVERISGTKMLVVPISSTQAVVLESRRVEGYDTGISSGVLPYLIDVSLTTGNGPMKMLPLSDTDTSKLTSILTGGTSLTYGSVTITVVASDSTGDLIQVVR